MDVSSNFFVLEINCTSQQTFVLVKAYLRRLQCNTLLSSKTSWRPLENILENVFKTSWKTSWRRLENTLKTSCKHVFKTSSRSLEGVFGRCVASTYWRRIKNVCEDGKSLRWRRLENVFKTSWRFLENLFVRRLEDVLKTFWRRLENVFKTSWRRMTKTNILVLIKTSWRGMSKANIFVLMKTSSEENERRLQDAFIKTNVCWIQNFHRLSQKKTCRSLKRRAILKIPRTAFWKNLWKLMNLELKNSFC